MPNQDTVSLSLARSQRIIELEQRIRAKYSDNDSKPLVDQRAHIVRTINELELKMIKATSFKEFYSYKYCLRCAQDALADFDLIWDVKPAFEPKLVEVA